MSASQTIKGYELHERIGSGGFGVVHRATQSTIGREVAIKIILPYFANQPDFIRRFETEAQIIARLEHLHIVPLYDYWRDLDGAYLVMRWLRGGNLREALANGPFQLESAALLLDQVASALAVAHRNGVVHRDLKPANILLDEDGNAYLSDFGIAKDMAAVNGGLTGSGMVLGSPDYLAPEQARSDPVKPQTDIYSLGVMLYELLTGQHPFPNCSSVERMYKHLNEPLPLITTLPAEVADGINGIVQKATAKDPALRYPDVLALAADFRREAALTMSSASIVEQLTFREQEVLQMIVDRCSNKEIAQRLFVTVATVKWHIHSVYQKLHVRNRVQAVIRARELNLIVSETTPEPTAVGSTYVAHAEPENPYKGLRAFQLADARDFFGRERLIQRIMQRLSERDKLARFLAIIGPSGSGKSSVVKAGIVPALWRGGIRGSDRWFVIEMKPGAYPLDELEIALTQVAANQTSNLREHLERDGRGLVRIANLILPNDESELVIIIDQFEEVFTLVADETKRAKFIDLICQGVTDPRSRVRIIITLRADFYDRPLQYADFGELVRSRMETVMPLSADELEAAITQPAARVGVAFEPGLVATIAGDVHYQPGALPLLQYALTELFEQRVNHTLTHEAYLSLGKAAGALAKRAEDLFHEQDETGQETIRQMFLRLVSLGEGTEDTRRRVPRSELLAIAASEDVIDDVLDTFTAYRLLTLDHDPATRRPTVEIAHEAILREWERLRAWLNESRHDIQQQRILSAAATEWSQADRDPSYLLRGARLEQMAGWAVESKLALTPQERSFLETSIAERTRQDNDEQERHRRELATQRQLAEQQRHAANRLRYLVVGLGIFTVVAVMLALFAFSREQQAQAAQRAAQRAADVNHSLVLASSSVDAYEHGDSILAMQLALESLNLEEPPPEAEIALREIAQSAGIRTVLYGHQHQISAVAVSPDGRFILSGSCADAKAACTTGELILWDVQKRAEIRRVQGHAGWVTSIVFSPDGQKAITSSSDGTAILWSLANGEVLRRFEGHNAGINSLAISPDGLTFVSASDDMTLIQWNIQTGDIIRTFKGHTDAVDCAAFSPDGTTILSGSADMTLIQWDAASGERLMTFEGHGARVTGAAFVPNRRVVSVTRDGGLYLWDAVTGTRLREQGFIGNPTELALSSNGRTAFLGEMGHLRAWSIDSWQSAYGLSFYRSGKQQITSLATSMQGGFGVYGTEQAYLIVWDLPSTGEIRRFGDDTTRYTFAAVTPDNRSLMLGTAAGEVIMQDRTTGEEIRRFSGAEGWIWRIVFSPDGQQMLVASADWYGGCGRGKFVLWEVATGTQIRSFTGFDYIPTWAGFSPDGQFVIGSTMQWGNAWSETVHGDTIVWNTSTGEEVVRLDTDQWVNVSLFTEDGRYIITGSGRPEVNGIVVWDAATGEAARRFLPTVPTTGLVLVPNSTTAFAGMGSGELIQFDYKTGEEIRRFCCHGNWVRYLDLSTDQRYVISADQSAIVILWDFATGEEIRRFYGHEGFAWEAKFSPDGQTAYSAGMDGSVIEWQIADQPLGDLIAWVRANRYVPDFTCQERVQYRIEPLCSELTSPAEAGGR